MQKIIINLDVNPNSTTPGLLQSLGFQLLKSNGKVLLYTDGKILVRLDTEKTLGNSLILSDDAEAGQHHTDPAGVAVYWKDNNWFEIELQGIEIPDQTLSLCGNFYEISIGLSEQDFKPGIKFWETQGFIIVENDPDKHTYVTLEWEGFKLSVYKRAHCPHLFNSPALTYFEQDMAKRILQLATKGIDFAQELQRKPGLTDSAIIQTQEGIHFFLFAY